MQGLSFLISVTGVSTVQGKGEAKCSQFINNVNFHGNKPSEDTKNLNVKYCEPHSPPPGPRLINEVNNVDFSITNLMKAKQHTLFGRTYVHLRGWEWGFLTRSANDVRGYQH